MGSAVTEPKHRQSRTITDVFEKRDFDSYKDNGREIRMKMSEFFLDVSMGTEVLLSGSRQRIDLTNEGKIVASLYPYDSENHIETKHIKVIGAQKGKRMMDVFQESCLNKAIVLELRKVPVAVMVPAELNNE